MLGKIDFFPGFPFPANLCKLIEEFVFVFNAIGWPTTPVIRHEIIFLSHNTLTIETFFQHIEYLQLSTCDPWFQTLSKEELLYL